jgi:serine/threonine-protein kinase RIO1
MEFIGRDSIPAPKLKNIEYLDEEEEENYIKWQKLFLNTIFIMRRL